MFSMLSVFRVFSVRNGRDCTTRSKLGAAQAMLRVLQIARPRVTQKKIGTPPFFLRPRQAWWGVKKQKIDNPLSFLRPRHGGILKPS